MNLHIKMITDLLVNIMKVTRDHPEVNLEDCFSAGQLKSKAWLVTELGHSLDVEHPPMTIFLLGGWYGSLCPLIYLSDTIPTKSIFSFDVDPAVAEIAETMNRSWVMDNWKFKATTKDIFDLNYDKSLFQTRRKDGTLCEISNSPDLIINTCGEHIDLAKWWKLIPDEKLCVIQSNDFFEAKDHSNCVRDIEELKAQVPMSQIKFQGTLTLENYKRFMVIGIK